MTRSLILSGGLAPYVDPWHPFAATTERIADVLRRAGHDVEVSFDVADRIADLRGVDLLISNAPESEAPVPPAVAALADAALADFLGRGGSVLAFHVGITQLLGLPRWNELIGARWVNGQTMHPPLGPARVTVHADERAGAARSFELHDELYTALGIDAELEVLVSHEYEGAEHPLIWAREVDGARVIADALGHGMESFDSPDHLEIVERSVRWLAHDH